MATVGVSVTDVRVALNNINTTEVSDDTIQQKIDDEVDWLEEKGFDIYSRACKKYIRSRAALRSFAVSKTYSSMRQGDLSVKKEWEVILNMLKDDVSESWADIVGSGLSISTSTPMFDDRPLDPLEVGDDDTYS